MTVENRHSSMKRFNYKAPAEDITTDKGETVIQLMDLPFADGGNLGAFIQTQRGVIFKTYNLGGGSIQGDGYLKMRETRYQKWLNVYRDTSGDHYAGELFKTERSAEFAAEGSAVATIKLEWEE